MLTQLEINHFKSWRATGPIRLAPITALFGSNSSGKTSLLQLLLMLKQTTDSPDRSQPLHLGDDRSLVELGTYHDLVFGHDLESAIEWDMTWKRPQALKIADPAQKGVALFQGDALGFAGAVRWQGNGDQSLGRAVVERLEYRFADHSFGMRPKARGYEEYDLYSSPPSFEFTRTRGRAWSLPAPAKCYGFPDQVRAYYQNAGFLSDLELEFEQLFARVFYLGPLRDYPQRQYTWAGSQPNDMGRRGERVVDALLAARESEERIYRGRFKKNVTLEERVAMWLKELGLIEHFEVRPVTVGSKLFQVWLRRAAASPEVLITDVGFGVSQILPVLTLCYYAPKGSTLILEQPEIHLHPRVQAGLADVFIDAIKTRGIQIILESHSEHLLRRLQRRVAEEKLAPKEAALYFCTISKGESRLEGLSLDLWGNIANWPQDFFGDEMGDLIAMSEAAARRRAAMQGGA
jgi:predicted ATPase